MPLPVVLLGNKCDLDEGAVDREQLDQYCIDHGFVGWFDTSAKLNINIDKAARFLVDKILEHQDIFQKKKVTAVSIVLFIVVVVLFLLLYCLGCISTRCGWKDG